MGVSKKVLRHGNGTDRPRASDSVAIEYTGWLYDASMASNDYKGARFDSSIGRGDMVFKIGEGRVIRGWDEGILGTSTGDGMTLGERALLVVTSDYAYGSGGFPGHIPPNSHLVFDIELKAINSARA